MKRRNVDGRRTHEQPPPPPRATLPDRLPWVKLSRIWVASDGRAWVERDQHLAEKRSLLDVFDTRGRLVAHYRLPESRQVVGFGRATLYAVHIDDDGLQWLERYGLQDQAAALPIKGPAEISMS